MPEATQNVTNLTTTSPAQPPAPQSMGEIMQSDRMLEQISRMAEDMASSKVTVPKHLQGSPGDCAAIIMQAMQWRMNPYAVAQKTHVVNGTLGYEAQLVNAVVKASGAISGSFHYEYQGDGNSLQCRVGAVLRGELEITWNEWLSIASVTTKNSPLWKTNPKQQMGYLQVKNWARQYAPEAILGVYTPDELHERQEREVGPGAGHEYAGTAASRTTVLRRRLMDDEDVEEVPLEASPVEEVPPYEGPSFAEVESKIYGASSPDALRGVAITVSQFLSHPDNEHFRDELTATYAGQRDKLRAQQETTE